jgi:hypothetical protein
MKMNARQVTKNYLAGMHEEAMRELSAMGVLVAPKTRHMEEQVMPWLLDRICDFLKEDEATIQGSSGVVDDGITCASNSHAATIKAKYDAIK